jgi:hypothetical protein
MNLRLPQSERPGGTFDDAPRRDAPDGTRQARSERVTTGWRGRTAEYALLAVVVLVQGAITWHFASQSFFFGDDFVVFEEALGAPLTLGYLAGAVLGQFSPGGRLYLLVLQRHAALDWNVALGTLVFLHAITVALIQRVLALVFGSRWWTYVLAFAYSLSIILLPSFEWFSGGLGRFVLSAMTLASLHGYLCWRQTRRWPWLAWSVAAMCIALSFYVKGLLIPVYLVLFRVLLLDRSSVRQSVAGTVREWRVWALYAIPAAVYLIFSATRDYAEKWHHPTLVEAIRYLRLSWVNSFVPGLFGIRVGGDNVLIGHVGHALVHTWVVALCQVLVIAVVVFSVIKNRFAWRAWVLFAFVFLVNAASVFPRVADWGAELTAPLSRYFVDFAFLVPIVLAFAFARPLAANAPASQRGLSWPRPSVAIVTGVALALYLALTLTTAAAITDDTQGKLSRRWVDNVRGDVARIRAEGKEPVVLNESVSNVILPFWIKSGANTAGAVLPVFIDGLRFDRVSQDTYRLHPDGHLGHVDFHRRAGGDAPGLLHRGLLSTTGARHDVRNGAVCISGAPGGFASLEFVPPRPLRGHDFFLQSTYTTSPETTLPLAAQRGVPYPSPPDLALGPKPSGGQQLTRFGALLTGVPTLGRFRIDVPGGRRACLSRLLVGYYAFS